MRRIHDLERDKPSSRAESRQPDPIPGLNVFLTHPRPTLTRRVVRPVISFDPIQTGSSGGNIVARKVRQNPLPPMNDLIFVAASVAFFVLSAAYAVFCERVR